VRLVFLKKARGKKYKQPERDDIIREMRARGETLKFIADHFGISHPRVAQICKK